MPDSVMRFLSVEDDAADARLLQHALTSAGFDARLDRVQTEAEFLQALRSAPPDVVFCDYRLPQFDALRALALLRKEGLDAPFLVVAGSIGEETAVEAVKRGADDYLFKDRLGRLGPAVRQALAQRELRAAERRAEAAAAEHARATAVRAGVASVVAHSGAAAEVLSGCCDVLVRFAGATYARIWTLDEASQTLELRCSAGLTDRIDDAYARVPIGRFKVGRIAASREPFHTNDLAGAPDLPGRIRAAETRTSSFAGCPLLVEGRLLGVLAMFSGEKIVPAMFEAICASADLVAQFLERKRAEAALRASEEQYRVLAESIPQLVWTARPDGSIEYLNRRALDYLGLFPGPSCDLVGRPDDLMGPPSDLVGRCCDHQGRPHDAAAAGPPWERAVHPDDLPEASARWRAAAGAGEAREAEFRLRGPDGAYRWHIARQVAVVDRGGAVVRWFGTCTDIHRQKEVEAELRHTGELLRAVSDATPDAVFVKDLQGKYLLFNPAASRFVGRPVEEVIGLGDAELFGPEGAKVIAERERRVVASGEAETEEETLTAAGATRIYSATKAPYRDAQGRIVGVMGVSRDVTERKRADEGLRLRDRAISALNNGVVIADALLPDQPLIYVSSGFTRLFGYSAEEACGRNCRFLQGKETDPAAAARLRKAVHAGEPCTVEILNYRKDGSPIWIEASVSPVRDESGRLTHFVGVQADVTARRRLEDQFRQAQKMEAVGRLAGGVAHDFNNLLTIVLGYSDLLLAGTAPSDPRRPALASIREAGERAGRLTAQLLAFSRKTIVEPKILDLNEVVEQILRMLGRLLGDDVVVESRLAPDLARVQADLGQIEQVVMNLAVNARDAMPAGGRLRISTADVLVGPGRDSVEDLPPGAYVKLSVADDGVGMTEEVKARIFEPFFTTKEQGKGTGLGLATVYGVVRAYGGGVAAFSERGVGSTFEVYLPAAPADLAQAASAPPRQAFCGKETVLVAEDEAEVRKLVRLALEPLGYTVLEAGDGAEALALFEADPAAVDLVLTDVVMPAMGGRELASALRRRRPGVKILYMTGYTDDAVVRSEVNDAVDGFLSKPFTPPALARKIRSMLDATP